MNKILKKEIRKNFNNLEILEEDYITVFGKKRKDVLQKWEDEYKKQGDLKKNERLDSFKRKYFKKYVDIDSPTPEALFNYYTSDEFSYLLLKDISNINLSPKLNPIVLMLIFNLTNRNIKILDYGCGRSDKTLSLLNLGYFNITFADIPHKFFKLFKQVIKRNFKSVLFHEITPEDNLTDDYDFIICNEVLEHVFEPEETLDLLIKHLKTKGYLYLSVFMDDMRGQDPSHLRKNTIRYNNPEVWHEIVKKKGLLPFYYKKDGVLKGWYKPF